MTPDPKQVEKAIGFLMNAFNQPEFEDADDEVNRSWRSVAYHMVEYSDRENAKLRELLKEVYDETSGDWKVWLKQKVEAVLNQQTVKRFDIWVEGYAATGEHDKAHYHGTYSGETFQEACINMMTAKGWDMEKYYDPKNNTFWACRFFDNETDARKSFG